MEQSGKIRFGPFELDAKAGELRNAGRRVRLQDKPLRLLVALLERRGDIVTRDELRERLWAGNIVVEFDNGLNNAVNKLRAALGDSATEPRYVETVGRRGYRFLAAIHEAATERPAAEAASKAATAATPEVAQPRATRRAWAWAAAPIAALALVGGALLYAGRSTDVPAISSLAVLPLANLSSDVEQEYFSDGMTDTLISQLSGIRSLRIISRQSVMRYKDSAAPMPTIARELGVDAIIEGTVLRAADRVRVTVQLVHAATDRHLWAAQYERPLGDVISLQAEIARTVANEVQAVVTPQETARLTAAQPVNPEAYDLYLRGRHFWSLRTEDSLRRSLDYFRRALEIEPKFARAHAALAEAYGPLGYNGWMSPDEATPNMKAAASRSLELDPDLVEGLTALGACAAFHEWHWSEAEQHFRRALEVSGNYSTAYGWYGAFLENLDRQPENLRARQRAFELDPLWVGTGLALGRALAFNGRIDEGIAVIERTLELDPSHPLVLSSLGLTYIMAGRLDDAVDALARSGDDGGLGYAYAAAGRRDEALAVLAQLETRANDTYVSPLGFALIHIGLGDRDAALAALERGVTIRDPGLSGLRVDPRFSSLAHEPRFQALLREIGLP